MKRVLIVTSELLLREGVESLLSREVDLNIMSTRYIDEATLTQEIDHYQPNVVILDERLEYTDLTNLFDLLIDYPRLRVMVVNVIDNKVNVYDKTEFEVSHSYDLISAIRQDSAFVGDDFVR
ncbi:MAG: response regulator transcription factor [Anaerolineales bacterium]|nr:response regulator transcription factor [Anaerolineales bacterium]